AATTQPVPTASTPENPANAVANPAPALPAGFAPPIGAALEFSANVSKVNNVATLRLSGNGRREIAGQAAWHLHAFARTENPLRIVFELDDQFDSYSAPGDFTSVQYEMRLSERGTKVNSIQRMTPGGREPAPPDATAARVLPGTRDPLGMMQYLRSLDWSKTPEVHGPVYDGRKLYEVKARKIGAAEVEVPAGHFLTNTGGIRGVGGGGGVRGGNFKA